MTLLNTRTAEKKMICKGNPVVKAKLKNGFTHE